MIAKEDDGMLSSQRQPEDLANIALRPKSLKDLIGQDQVKNNLEIQIQAAKQRGEALEHVLFMVHQGWGRRHFRIY